MHTDANEMAGAFEEIFGRDVTNVVRLCQNCHRRHAVGSHLMYRGSGMVMRCPTCGHPAAVVMPVLDGNAVSLHGAWMLTSAS
jgi:hypothetical protein